MRDNPDDLDQHANLESASSDMLATAMQRAEEEQPQRPVVATLEPKYDRGMGPREAAIVDNAEVEKADAYMRDTVRAKLMEAICLHVTHEQGMLSLTAEHMHRFDLACAALFGDIVV